MVDGVMKRCERCNRKRGIFSRLLGLDKDYCDDCLPIVNQEIREKQEVPVNNSKKIK
jgi:hypothetical protein